MLASASGIAEIAPSDIKPHSAGVDAMQPPDTPRHQHRPAAAAAAGIEAHRIDRQAVPRKETKILPKQPCVLFRLHDALVEAPPFAAEIGNGARIYIIGIRPH